MGLGMSEKFLDGVAFKFGYPGEMFLTILNLQVASMSPIKFQFNPTYILNK